MKTRNWENVIDEMGRFCIIVRATPIPSPLRDGLIIDIVVDDYFLLAEFARRYDICIADLQRDFVRLMVHRKRE